MFEVEPEGESEGICDCCGNHTRAVWGYVHKKEGAIACYYFQWTVNKSIEDHPANFDLIYGPWGEGSQKTDRVAISLIHFEDAGTPGVSIIDATNRPVATGALVGSALTRDDVIGTPLADEVFAIFDAVIVQDHRLS